jgi:hypothetical protein
VKSASLVTGLCGIALATVGCVGARDTEVAGPMVTVGPDDFVLRDVRKDAARRLRCQAPMVDIQMGPWAGSEGNVTAVGCGYHLTYYLRCQTSHQCSISVSD